MHHVITAIVMVAVEADKIPEVAQEIADLEGVSEVYSVAGDADLIAIVRVREFDQVAEVIAGRLSKVQGVVHTDTHLAFRAYSRHDLDAAFSLGLESG
jgi:DNA-binding Lrp family transcriptional regulator